MIRLSGVGEEMVVYFGKGDIFGLEELWYNWWYLLSYLFVYLFCVIGYVDILRILIDVFEEYVFFRVDLCWIEFLFDVI